MSEHNNQPIKDTHFLERRLRILIEEVRSSFERLAKSITEPIEESLRQVQEVVRTALEELPAKSREALTILGKHGWYLDTALSLPELTSLAELLRREDVKAAERVLADHYRARLSQIEHELAAWCPVRAKILTPAFDAHRRGEYVLSIPVFLAQADGVCKASLDVSLFGRRYNDRLPLTAKAIETRQLDRDSIEAALLHPLKVPLPISASKQELTGLLNVLNRHEILHGTSVDYGTEVNSLKAISLLYYVASVLRKPDDDSSEQNLRCQEP
ncbi:MAG: hypothetical protein HZA95_04045 [Candidatus Vogelbacteria bacterium]|nr:hypothetical protein [Candidatus Vogelbacteria bacterium]